MQILCTSEFRQMYERMLKNNSYRSLETDLYQYLSTTDPPSIYSGTNLNQSADTPYIKKRLNGRGGFRIYFFAIIRDNMMILVFVHPKTGALGIENISDADKKASLRQGIEAIEQQKYYLLSFVGSKIIFDTIGL